MKKAKLEIRKPKSIMLNLYISCKRLWASVSQRSTFSFKCLYKFKEQKPKMNCWMLESYSDIEFAQKVTYIYLSLKMCINNY